MPEMHQRQPTVLAGHLLKTEKKIQKFEKTGDSKYIYQKELDKSLISTLYGLWRF